MRLSDLDARVFWILIVSASVTILGFCTLIVLERWGEHRHARVNPPFYLHKAAFGLLVVGLVTLVIATLVLGLSFLLN